MIKKFLFFNIFFIFSMNIVFAQSITFGDQNFDLKYSDKSTLTKGFINEYYKPKEIYPNWTELIGVFSYPNETSPISAAKNLEQIVLQTNGQAQLFTNEKNSKALITFVEMGRNDTTQIIEYNIFKFQKDKNGKVIALQFAKRYNASSKGHLDYAINDISKRQNDWIKLIADTPIPTIVQNKIGN